MSDLRLLDYSAMAVNEATLDAFDPLETERLRKLILAYGGDKALLELSDQDLYKALGFVRDQRDELTPTITGILLIGKEAAISRFVPTAASAFQVLEGTSVRVNEDYSLPVLAAIERLIQHLEAWNPERELEMGLFRMPAPDFNKRAIREAIVNAFSHRDYTKMGRVRVAVADEGLTMANPGGFIEGITVDNLLTAEPHGRNPLLADALKRIGLAEKTGRGIDRIFEGSLIYGRLLPDYSASTQVTVSLFIPRSSPDMQIAKLVSDEQNRLGRPLPINTLLVLNALKELPKSDIHQIATATKLSETVVKAIVEKTAESGLIEAFGSGRGRSYMLSRQVYNNKQKTAGYVRQKDIDEIRYRELILNLARNSQFIARADVVKLLHVNEAQAYRLLRKLVDDGQLEAVNKGHYAKYRLRQND
jgi:ATP-dependent DNA helicase RecG